MQLFQRDLTPNLSPLLKAFFNGQIPHATAFTPDWKGLRLALDFKVFSQQQRELLVAQWSQQYGRDHERQKLVASLISERVFTATTGHQLCLASGPAYTIYKICSTVALAQLCNRTWPDRTIIPVFWMASEDHDFAEINHINGKTMHVQWDTPHGGPVGRLSAQGVLQSLEPWLVWLREHGAEEWAKLLEAAYRTNSLAEAFGQLIDGMFKDQDLLVLDADRPELKSAFAPIMWRELTENTVASAMKSSEQWLIEHGFPQQIKAREINLFYQTNDARKRIVRDGEMWRAIDSPMHWNAHELQNHLSANPECFSPNVALRPVYQEVLLPNIAYVGGPGEIQYWLQLKPVFDAFDVQMPVVLLRDSAVLVNQASAKKWRKWGADENMFQSNFASELAKMVQEHAVDLTSAKQCMLDVMESLKQQLSEIDPSLVTAADMELKKQMQGLETIEKKMAKVIRQKEEIKSQQLKAFFDDIQPNGEPQDRYCNFIDVQAQFGIPILPALLNAFDPVSRKVTIIVDVDPSTTARESQH